MCVRSIWSQIAENHKCPKKQKKKNREDLGGLGPPHMYIYVQILGGRKIKNAKKGI